MNEYEEEVRLPDILCEHLFEELNLFALTNELDENQVVYAACQLLAEVVYCTSIDIDEISEKLGATFQAIVECQREKNNA